MNSFQAFKNQETFAMGVIYGVIRKVIISESGIPESEVRAIWCDDDYDYAEVEYYDGEITSTKVSMRTVINAVTERLINKENTT